MTETSVNKIEAQASKKVKGAKATRTSNISKISATMTRARRKFQQQLKKTQNLQTKIDCILEVAEEVYGSSSVQMVRHDLFKEAGRLTNLVNFTLYCRSLGVDPSYVAQHIVFDGIGIVNKVIRDGVESVYGTMILAYGEPLFELVWRTDKTVTPLKMSVAHVTAEQLMAKAPTRMEEPVVEEELSEEEATPALVAEYDVEEETAA